MEDLQGKEQTYLSGVSRHESLLGVIAKKLPLETLEERGFSDQVEQELKNYFLDPQNEQLASALLSEALGGFSKLQVARSPGHDLSHIVDNLASAVRILATERRKTYEVLEVFLGVTTHDFNRTFEKILEKPSQKEGNLSPDEAASLLIIAFSKAILRGKPQLKSFPSAMIDRVIFDISTGSEPKTPYWTANIVHQCDREQLIGPATIARGLAFDVVESGRQIPIPLLNDLKTKLPLPERPDDKYWLVQYEFFMRNLYPPASEDDGQVWRELKVDNAAILLLATEGKENVRRQVFAPELEEVDETTLHWTKKKLPEEILPLAQKTARESLDYINQTNPYDPEIDLVAKAVKMLEVEGVSSPKDFKARIKDFIDACDEVEKRNLYYVLSFTEKRRGEDREKMIKLSEKLASNEGLSRILRTAAKFVSEEYKGRNKTEKGLMKNVI